MFFLIATLTSWVKSIIFVVLFATFLELLLPSSSMQRFIRVIMGLFIMLSILNPLIDVAQNYITPTKIPVFSTHSAQSIVIMNQAKEMAGKREEMSIELYKKELAQQMRVMITTLEGVADAKVMIDMKQSGNDKLGSGIHGIQVYVTLGMEAKRGEVSKVSIGESSKPTELFTIDLENKIKKMITELYQLPKEKVEVKIVHS